MAARSARSGALQPFYIIGPDGQIRGNNRQFARAAQAVLRVTF